MALQRIVSNLSKTQTRYDYLDGKKYLVVPMVMLTEGVHAGSNGPLYYPKAELEKTPVVWNHKPIVVYHPQINGEGVSACDPVILNTRSVGLIMNASFDGRLKAEAWIDEAKANTVDPRVLAAVNKGETMEISTGLFTDNEETPGEFNGEQYVAIARNYRPDHLAILPDMKGACSIADGAGLLRNEALTANAESYASTMDAVRKVVRAKYPNMDAYVEDVYPDFAVYSLVESPGNALKMYRQDYSISNGVAELTGDREEVIRVTEYRRLDGTFVGNTSPINNSKKEEKNPMTKKELVDKLVANSAKTGVQEGDRETLMTLSEKVLESMVKNAEGATEQKTEEKKEGETTEQKTETPVQPQQPAPAQNGQQPVTLEQYVNAAPAGIRDFLIAGVTAHNAQRQELIQTITTNKANTFTSDMLNAMPTQTLQSIAALAKVPEQPSAPIANWAGAAGAFVPDMNTPVQPLSLPTMNFAKPK